LPDLPLRAPEVRHWLERAERGMAVAPLDMLRLENDAYPDGSHSRPPPLAGDRRPHSAAGPQLPRS
jgi:hypothetical protein